MTQRKSNVSVLDTATRYIAAAEAELAANPNDRQLRDLVETMREVIRPGVRPCRFVFPIDSSALRVS